VKLLTHESSNAKLGKNADHSAGQWETWILYLAPSDTVAGMNTCPAASPGCRAACLYKAGRGQMTSVQMGRIRKTELLRDDPAEFSRQLVRDLEAVARRARRNGVRAAVRLNGTSDIAWESFAVERHGHRFDGVPQAFPELLFYDYTKLPFRALQSVNLGEFPSNYRITFSRSEVNESVARRVADAGVNVAVVFLDHLPETWGGRPVIDGTTHDMRFLDPQGVVVGLIAKGSAARKDTSGFIVRDAEPAARVVNS
jgi:hypothetical protein